MKTKYYSIDTLTSLEKKEIDTILREGGLIAFPTETVYGIGCGFDQLDAIEKLYQIKNRPESKAFSVHLGSSAQIPLVAEPLDARLSLLIDAFCPGPVTFVVKKKKNLSSRIGTESTVGIRIPDDKRLCDFINYHQRPIVGSSANISSLPPAKNVEEVAHYFDGKIEVILDGGPCKTNRPSTVVSIVKEPFEILREGEISLEAIERIYNQQP